MVDVAIGGLAVDVGGVEERDPAVDGGVNDGLHLGHVDASSKVVAPQAHDGDGEAGVAEPTVSHVHGVTLSS
jgi:hypothetical protein